jgi:hypothetical protein
MRSRKGGKTTPSIKYLRKNVEKNQNSENKSFLFLAVYLLLFSGKMLESPNYLGKWRQQQLLLRSLPVKVMISRDCRRRKSLVETYKNESSVKIFDTLFLYEIIIKII